MIIIGARAHTIKEIDEVCRLGYPFCEISLNDPHEVEEQMHGEHIGQ